MLAITVNSYNYIEIKTKSGEKIRIFLNENNTEKQVKLCFDADKSIKINRHKRGG